MRRADAPRAGWYPDPHDRARLRWWDGLDWTDLRRAPPSDAELLVEAGRASAIGAAAAARSAAARAAATGTARAGAATSSAAVAAGLSRHDAQEIITEVRNVARSEAQRAADLVTQRARSASRELAPLISEYTSKFTKLVRRLVVIAVILVIAWFVFQAIAQVTFFEWLGERIDNVTDGDSIGPGTPGRGWRAGVPG